MTQRGAERKPLKKIKDETEYYPHQTEAIRWMARMSSLILADDMGLGKSLQALTVAAIDYERGLAKRTLIVCPSTLKWNWADEIQEHTKFNYIVVDGSPKKREEQMDRFINHNYDILIMNYEQLIPHFAAVNKMDFHVAIFDEAHYLKNRKSKRTQAALKLATGRNLLLTGSPMLNNVLELWTMLHMVDPERFHNYWRFANRYAVFGGYKNSAVVGLKNQDELNMILSEYMIRRLKKDVLDLPDKQMIPVRVDLLPNQRKIYDQAKEELFIELPNDPSGMDLENSLVKLLRLKQICGTTACLPDYPDESAKLDKAMELIREMTHDEPDHPGEHVVVFTQFRAVQACLMKRLADEGIAAFMLNGDTPKEIRQNEVAEWSHNPEPAVMVAMLQVAGVGLNMTAASKMILIDKLWVPKLNDQAIDRIHRIGASTTKPVQVYMLVCRNTIESRIEAILKLKDKTFKAVVDDTNWKKALYAAIMTDEDE